jgi:uncharacterized protein
MPTFLDGQQNLSALQVPGVYVDILPPQPFLNGVPTNMMGVVGVASWGPVGSPVPMSGPDSCATVFGTPTSRTGLGYKYDMASYIWAASQIGPAVGFWGVRVTDSTDVAASIVVQSTCITITGKYTGVLGNQIKFSVATGSALNSFMAIVEFPGRPPEIFNNITGSGNALWLAMAAAINNGNNTRGPSSYVTASAGAGTTAPTLTSYTLTGGTDGTATITDTVLMGQDTIPRKGMYALRRTGMDGFALCDHSTYSNLAAMDVFALSENAFVAYGDVSGQTIAQGITNLGTAAVDDFPTWFIVGDYPTFYDSANQTSRLVNPAAIALGIAGNLSPEQTPLNKQLRGVTATSKTQASGTYSDAELMTAETGRVDLIVGPPTTPGGNYFTFITGRNASSNTAANGVNYTRLTFYLARSLQSKAAGSIVGRMQSIQANDRTRSDAKALVDGFLGSLLDPSVGSNGNGIIDAFATVCDLTNNPPILQARGFLFLYAAVRYLNEVRYFVIKLAGGGNVTVTQQATAPQVSQFL